MLKMELHFHGGVLRAVVALRNVEEEKQLVMT